jgi:hypothetical protein
VAKRPRKRSSSRVDRRDLAPLVAEGFTEDVPLDRVEQELPPERPQSRPTHLNVVETVPGTRVPVPRFYVEDDPLSVLDIVTGRTQRHARITLNAETLGAMKAGMICLRCMEPQESAFPEVCGSPPEMACNYPIAEHQLRDIAVEYEGEQALGPTQIEGSE